MSAAHVRRGGAARAKSKKQTKVAVPKKFAKRLPIDHARANKIASVAFGAFMLAIAVVVVLVALDIPAKAERTAGTAVGHAGFRVSGYQIVGINHMDRKLVDAVVTDELHRAADEAGSTKAPAGFGRRRSNPPQPHARLWLGPGCPGVAASARHAGHRYRRAQAGCLVAEPGTTRTHRSEWCRSRSSSGRQDARPAAADRPGRQFATSSSLQR